MPRIHSSLLLPGLGLLLLTSGCEDAIGLGATCTSAMSEVRRKEGGPPDSSNRRREGGDFREEWIYSRDQRPYLYTFRWGASFETCQVTGPITLNVGSLVAAAPTAWVLLKPA